MSAFGYKRTCGEVRQRVRFTPKSGHSSDIRALLLSGTLCTDGGLNFSAHHQCGAG